jgi:hypothetical protein
MRAPSPAPVPGEPPGAATSFPIERVSMNAPGAPRFRIRTADGSVEAVASVEALSAKVEAGAVDADTQLFDSGTGQWNRAGDVPVFQFVVEELRAEGRLDEAAFEGPPEPVIRADPVNVEPVDPGVEFSPIEHGHPEPPPEGARDRPLAPPTVDPFELHLPLEAPEPWKPGSRTAEAADGSEEAVEAEGAADPSDAGSGPPLDTGETAPPVSEEEAPLEPWYEDRPYQAPGAEAPPVRPEPPEGEREAEAEPTAAGPPSGEDPPAPSSSDWITHGPPEPRVAPRLSEETPDDAGDPDASDPEPVVFDGRFGSDGPSNLPGLRAGQRAGEPGSGPRPETPPEEPDVPLDIRTAWEDDAEQEDPRAARIAARRRQRNVRVMGTAGAAIVVVLGIAAIVATLGSDGDPAGPLADAPTLSPPDAAAAPLPDGLGLPPALEAEAELLWAALPGRINRIVDSMRVEAGIPETPPREWLGGFYLANARDFPGVPAFWDAYEAFVADLQAREEATVRQAVNEHLDTRDVPGPDRRRLVDLLELRRPEVAPVRDDRYLHLRRTAAEARAFHEFLVLNTALIRYAPALGGGVSDDPVLEAVAETPEVRRQLEAHLDRIFEALDRTRAGGQPSPAGLRAELFGNLGYPL